MRKCFSVVCLVLFTLIISSVSAHTISWECAHCGYKGNEGNFCVNCGAKADETWKCNNCQYEGNTGNFCVNCGAPKDIPSEPKIINTTTGTLKDDQCISEVFLKYANSLAKVSYKEVKEYLDSLGYKYDTEIGPTSLATFNIPCELGSLYICFYPLESNDSAFGNPEKEMLSCLEYSRDNRWITISDSMHINGGELKTGDRLRDPVNQEVPSIDIMVKFYNNEIGGDVSLKEELAISTDLSRKNAIEATVKARIKEYINTTIQQIEVNSNVGTNDPDDFIILLYFSWGTMNGVDMTKTMLEMFSDDMAYTLASKYENASEIVLFWEVPYLLKSGTCAKYAYDIRNGGAYRTEKAGPLYR